MFLKLENIKKNYIIPGVESPYTVLKDISLQVDKGESIAIIGPSGSGKSTLLNIMGALDRPSSGSVHLAKKDLAQYSDKDLSKGRNQDIGFIFQLHHLLPQCTVLENVLLPTIPFNTNKNGEATDRAKKLLERVGLSDRMFNRPGQLSGGECQRTAVVRALINNPGLLLADEPTGSLDESTASDLGQLLIDLNKEEGVALVVVTHSLQLALHLNKIYKLHEGGLEVVQPE